MLILERVNLFETLYPALDLESNVDVIKEIVYIVNDFKVRLILILKGNTVIDKEELRQLTEIKEGDFSLNTINKLIDEINDLLMKIEEKINYLAPEEVSNSFENIGKNISIYFSEDNKMIELKIGSDELVIKGIDGAYRYDFKTENITEVEDADNT